MQVSGEIVEAHGGSAVLVPRGTPHAYWNFLLMPPNIYGLIQDVPSLKERTPASLRAVFTKHDSELLEG